MIITLFAYKSVFPTILGSFESKSQGFESTASMTKWLQTILEPEISPGLTIAGHGSLGIFFHFPGSSLFTCMLLKIIKIIESTSMVIINIQ